jgi:polygalacturonase
MTVGGVAGAVVVGSRAKPAGAASHFVEKGELFLSVKDFGAKGDGSSNDAGAIQGSIDALIGATEANVGTVYLPPGTYFLGTTSVIRIDFHWRC